MSALWSRISLAAREAIVSAGSPTVCDAPEVQPEHLLYAIASEVARQEFPELRDLGESIDWGRVHSSIEREVSPGASNREPASRSGPRFAMAFERAYLRARANGETRITLWHIVHGIFDEGSGLAFLSLRAAGMAASAASLESGRATAFPMTSAAARSDTGVSGQTSCPCAAWAEAQYFDQPAAYVQWVNDLCALVETGKFLAVPYTEEAANRRIEWPDMRDYHCRDCGRSWVIMGGYDTPSSVFKGMMGLCEADVQGVVSE